MKRARNLLASLALLGSATLGLAGCTTAVAAGDVTPASYYGPGLACTDTYPGYCDGYWGDYWGGGWGGDHWWRGDRVHHVSHEHGFDHGGMHGFDHGGGFGHAGGFGHGGGGHGGGGHGR
jgi:hypothetical protein